MRVWTKWTVCVALLLVGAGPLAAQTNVTSKWENGNLIFWKRGTGESVLPVAPVVFHEDFLGMDFLDNENGSVGIWETVEVSLNTAIGVKADAANGILSMILDADSNAEDAVLYWGDQRGIDVSKAAIFEARVALAVLPTASVTVVFGMVDDHHLDKDTVASSAWFRLQGTNGDRVLVETDDTTNNNDDVDTGLDIVAAAYHYYRIDFGDLSDVRFYIDGDRVGAGTTFDMSNLSAAEAVMQPYFSLDKGSGTPVGTMDVDYVRIWSNRE